MAQTQADTDMLRDNAVTDAKLRQGVACSVVGRGANSTGNVADIAVNADGKFVVRRASVLTADVLGTGDLPGGNWVGSQSGSATLGSVFTLNAANGTYQDTGLSVTLPAAGTYLVWVTVRSSLAVSAGVTAYILMRLWNTTDAAAVANSERLCSPTTITTGQNYDGIGHAQVIITVTASKTIRLECSRNGGTTYSGSTIPSDANGRTAMGYVRIY